MPRLASRALFTDEGLQLRRVVCDGVDERGSGEEFSDEPRAIVVLHGRFRFEDSRTRAIASPAISLVLGEHQPYRIRHLDGGDECLGIGGDVCRELLGQGPTARRVSAEGYVRLHGLARALVPGLPRLCVEELIAGALDTSARPWTGVLKRRDCGVVDAIAYRLERSVDARLSLPEVTAGTGVSLFHACRIFRRATGMSIHRYQQEVRLRHALALVMDTVRPIAQLAVDTGFANQGHLTNLFRRRFRTTPARARRFGLPR